MQSLFVCMRERERMNILTSLWQPLIDISWMRLKSLRTGSASKLARMLHLQLFFSTCKLPACHASKLTLPFVWNPVSKRLLPPDCQSELSSALLRHVADCLNQTLAFNASERVERECVVVCLWVFVSGRAGWRHAEAVCSHMHDTLSPGADTDDTVWI